MFTLSEKDQETIIKYMANAATYAETEKDPMVVAAKLFSDAFEEASEDDGLKFAERLYSNIKYFKEQTEGFSSSTNKKEALNVCLQKFENEEDKIKALRFTVGSLNNSELSFERTVCDEEEFLGKSCDELVDELLGIVSQLTDNFDMDYLTNIYSNSNATCVISEDEIKNEVLYSMAFYCAAKKDELSFVPNEIFPEQCAIAVSAACKIKDGLSCVVDDDSAVVEPGAYYPSVQDEQKDYSDLIVAVAIVGVLFIMQTILVVGFSEIPEVAIVLAIVFALYDIALCLVLLQDPNVSSQLGDLLSHERVKENKITSEKTEASRLKSAAIYAADGISHENEEKYSKNEVCYE